MKAARLSESVPSAKGGMRCAFPPYAGYTDLEDQVPLESLDCTLALAEIYDKVTFAQGNRI